MSDLTDESIFSAALFTSLSRKRVARLFGSLGWKVRKCSWTDYEVRSPFAELVIEAEKPILLHGPMADIEANVGQVLALLQQAGIAHHGECYDAGGGLLQEFRWGDELN